MFEKFNVAALAAFAIAALVTGHANGFDNAYIQFAGDNSGGNKAAARDGDNALPRTFFGKAPRQRSGIALKLIPTYGKIFARFQSRSP